MADVSGFLSVLQLGDSAFPSGRYTLSYGLEAFAQDGQLHGPRRRSALLTLLSDCIRLGVAPSDGVALACAHRAAAGTDGDIDLDLAIRADERLTAVKLVREVREASMRTGRALMATAKAAFEVTALADYYSHVDSGNAPGNHAVALGLVSARLGVARLEAVAGELFAFSAGWAAAAVRLGVLDHRAAQRLLHRTRPVSAEAALRVIDRDVEDISSCSPLPDVMSMRHEQAGLRLFAT
jgi:urease accessory protein